MGVIVAKWACDKCGKEMFVFDLNYREIKFCTRCHEPRKISPRPPMPKFKYKPTMLTEILNDDSKWQRVNSLADVRVGDIYVNLNLNEKIIKQPDGESIMYALKNPYLVNGRNCVESCSLRECRDYFTEVLNNN